MYLDLGTADDGDDETVRRSMIDHGIHDCRNPEGSRPLPPPTKTTTRTTNKQFLEQTVITSQNSGNTRLSIYFKSVERWSMATQENDSQKRSTSILSETDRQKAGERDTHIKALTKKLKLLMQQR